MYLIAGLGNPTTKYEKTRHNMGFDMIDVLSEKLGIKLSSSKFNAYVGKGDIDGEKVLLVKPLTYMNLSGDAVQAVMNYYKIEHDKLIVAYDDTDMDIGMLRIRKKGSAGGHNGMKSIIACIGTDEFPRIRIGIGNRGEIDMVDFVLGRFGAEDRKIVDETIEKAAEAAVDIVKNGTDHAMNRYN